MNIVKKELREIFRDPRLFLGMVIVPLLMFPLMGSAVRVSMEATQQYQRVEAGVMDIDAQDGNASLSVRFRSTMELMNIIPVNVSVRSVDSGVKWCTDHGLSTLVVIPARFTESILEGRSTDVSVYQVLRNYGQPDFCPMATVVLTIMVSFALFVCGTSWIIHQITPASLRRE
jgi:ABC-2 type transport system permease protein